MEDSRGTYKKEYRNIIVKTSDGSDLLGKINIGDKERVSDLFSREENPFIILSDVEHKDGSGKVLFINKNHIVWVEPRDY
jgi:small nuclear ribonucleoprotein (snRNP)-like protein